MPIELSKTCCPQNEIAFADQLKALGHPVRLKLVQHLMCHADCCCGQLCECFDQSQSTVSQHLSVLVEAGLLKNQRRGNRMHYAIRKDALEQIVIALQQLTNLRPITVSPSEHDKERTC